MLKKLHKREVRDISPTSSPLVVYTDGAAIGNPGPGGYAVTWLGKNGRPKTIVGGAVHSTNNRMELMAIECAMRKSPPDRDLVICSDSNTPLKA